MRTQEAHLWSLRSPQTPVAKRLLSTKWRTIYIIVGLDEKIKNENSDPNNSGCIIASDKIASPWLTMYG